jgi:hypothetical protein
MMAAEDNLLIFEGASAGRYPKRSRPSEQRRNIECRETRCGLRSSPKDEAVGRRRGKNRQLTSAHRVAVIQVKGHKAFGFVAWHGGLLCWLGTYSPLRGCSCQAALPAVHSSRNGLYAIYSALPSGELSVRDAFPITHSRFPMPKLNLLPAPVFRSGRS